MKSKIWDFWAKRYNKLWVQKYSLRPTREYLLNIIPKDENLKVLDLGCGPGELIEEILKINPKLDITGIDFSQGMIDISKERNPKAKHIKMDVKDLGNIEEKFNIIVCTHSLPYYKDIDQVMKDLDSILLDEGMVYLGFASGNSLYDKFVLSFVKLTTGPAYYPSDRDFRKLISPYFNIEDLKIIKEKIFMPRIAIYTLKKVNK